MRSGARAIILFGLVAAIGFSALGAPSQTVPSEAQPGVGPPGTQFHPGSLPPGFQVIGGEAPLGYEGDLRSFKARTSARSSAQVSASESDRGIQPSAPALRDSFSGIPFGGFIPPDPHIAVGPNHVMQVVNTALRITTKTGSALQESSFAQWWQQQFEIFDPWVVYDQHSSRWVLIAVGRNRSTSQSWYMISTSQTADPTGNWCRWSLDGSVDGSTPSSNWADYPKLGFDNQAFYVTSNQFRFSDDVYQYSKVRIMAKDQFYSCGAIRWWDFTGLRNADGSTAFTVQPAVTFGQPGKQYLVSAASSMGNSLSLWSVTNPTGTPPTLAGEAAISVGNYSAPPNAAQLSGGTLIDTGDARLLNAVYRDGSLYTGHTVSCNSGFSCARAIVINVSGFTARTFTVGLSGFYYYYPALMPDSLGNLWMIFNRSGASEYAGARYTVLPAGGSEFQSSSPLKDGEAGYVQLDSKSRNRWGDYNGIALDPADPTRVWLYSEYARSIQNTWGTWVGSSTFSSVSTSTNDNFANAVVVAGSSFTSSINTLSATTEGTDPTPSCGNGSRGKSVWYRFTAPNSGTLTADTIGSNYDTVLSVWTGSLGFFTDITCNDDITAISNLQSRVAFSAVAGVSYYFMISAYNNDGGNLVFNVTLQGTSTPIPSAAFLTLIPHSAGGGGYVSRVFLTNLTGNTNSVIVNRIAQSGSVISSARQTLQPGGTLLVADSEAGRNAPISLSWFAIGSERPIAASILFDFDARSLSPPSNLRQSVGSLSSPPLSAFTAPVRFAGSDAAVGVALANPNNATTTVTLKLIDQNGTILATDSLTLVAFGQTAFVLSDRQAFRNALLTPAEFVGSLAVTTLNPGAPVSAMVVGALGNALFSLPVASGVGR